MPRCTSAGPKPYATKTVKLDGEDFTYPKLHYPQCERTDVLPDIDQDDPGTIYHHCPLHRRPWK